MGESPRVAELRRRLRADPRSLVFGALAEELRRAGALEEAIETCVAGLAHHAGYTSARVTLGRALLEAGQPEAAREELERAIAEAPENLVAQRTLIEACRALGLEEEARRHCRVVKSLAPDDEGIAALMAELGVPDAERTSEPVADAAPEPASEPVVDAVFEPADAALLEPAAEAFDAVADAAFESVAEVLPEPEFELVAPPEQEPAASEPEEETIDAHEPTALSLVSDEPVDWPWLLPQESEPGDAVAGPDAPSDAECAAGTGLAPAEAPGQVPADEPDLVVAFEQALDRELNVAPPPAEKPAEPASPSEEPVESALERFLAAIRRERQGRTPPVDLAS